MQQSPASSAEKAHPFELAGMGRGPYTWAGFYDLAASLDPNSATNFGNMGIQPDRPKLKAGMGTCACCGMGIMNICIVKDADGDLWGVGEDCISKTDDPCLGEKAKIAIARKRSRLRKARQDAKRHADHVRWLSATSTAPDALPGETNQQRIDRINAANAAASAERMQKLGARKQQFNSIISTMQAIGNAFYSSLATQLAAGPLSARQANYVAKAVLIRRSSANAAQWDELVAAVQS